MHDLVSIPVFPSGRLPTGCAPKTEKVDTLEKALHGCADRPACLLAWPCTVALTRQPVWAALRFGSFRSTALLHVLYKCLLVCAHPVSVAAAVPVAAPVAVSVASSCSTFSRPGPTAPGTCRSTTA
eukprot:359093-Chlamydomonas_euryale.AAC.6